MLAVQSHTDEHRYTPRDQELLTFVSYHIANALERKRNAESLKQAYSKLEQRVVERTGELAAVNRDLREQIMVRERVERQLKYENLHDALTGLPNRNFLLERLSQALAAFARDPRQRFAVLFLDLDRFKVVNDSVGHLVGDELLNEVGARIAAALEPRDLVARLGGDEFAIVLHDIENADDASAFAQRIIETLNAPIRLGGKELFTSASIGIAMAAPHYRQAEELLRDADVAMYRAKSRGPPSPRGVRRTSASGSDAPARSRRRPAPRDRAQRVRAVLPADPAPVRRAASSATRRCCAGVIRSAACSSRPIFSASPRTPARPSRSTGRSSSACSKSRRRCSATGAEFVSINLSGRHFRSETLGDGIPGAAAAALRRAGQHPHRSHRAHADRESAGGQAHARSVAPRRPGPCRSTISAPAIRR